MTNMPTGPGRPLWGPPDGPSQQVQEPATDPGTHHNGHAGHSGHRWMMLICCVPMILVVGALIVSGAATAGTLLWPLACVAMMAAMMFMMPGGHNHK